MTLIKEGRSKIQTKRRQNRILRIIADAPWFVRNNQLQRDLDIPYIADYIRDTALKFFASPDSHPNPALRDITAGYDEDTPFVTSDREPFSGVPAPAYSLSTSL